MRKVLLASAALAAAGIASADEASINVGQRNYLAILPDYEIPDSGRGVLRSGAGISLLLGHQYNEYLGMEVNGHLGLFTTGRNNGTDFYQEGGTIDVVLTPWDRNGGQLVTPFVVGGVGGVFNDVRGTRNDGMSLIFGGGAGLVSSDLYHGMKLRTEMRFIHDEFQRGYNDYRLSFGVEIALGSKSERRVVLPPPPVEFREIVREVPRPFIDSDGDGVPDERDKCPDTPRGLKVDADGCVIPDQIIELRGITFEFNKTRLTPNSEAVLDNVVKAFLGQPSLKVEIGGHTDSIGSVTYNQRLSQGRAEAVREYLVKVGAGPQQIIAVGYGKLKPLISPEKNDDDRELNRRVEFKVVGN